MKESRPTVTFLLHENTEPILACELQKLLQTQLRKKTKVWYGKVIFGAAAPPARVTLCDVYTQESIELNICPSRVSNVLMLRDGSFILVELVEQDGILHKYDVITRRSVTLSLGKTHPSRPTIYEYNDFILVGISTNYETRVFSKSLELLRTLPYGTEQMISTFDGSLLLFTGAPKNKRVLVMLNPKLEKIKSRTIVTACERLVQIGFHQFYCLGSASTSWDSVTNAIGDLKWLRYAAIGIALHDGRLAVSKMAMGVSEIVVYEKHVFGKEPQIVAKLTETLISRWDNSFVEVRPGVLAFHGLHERLVIWEIDKNMVTRYKVPASGYIRCFVFE